jgi:hypothetical protein
VSHPGRMLAATLVALAALTLAPAALALDCPNIPLDERLQAAEVAFVGRVTDERPALNGPGVVYRFVVDQRVKGSIGREVEVTAPVRLVDAADEPLVRDEALGVMAALDGARIVTESCLLTDPGALLSTSDEPKGDWIKIVIGLAILALVLAFSIRRLNRRELPRRSSLDG